MSQTIRSITVAALFAFASLTAGFGQDKPKTLVETGIELYRSGKYQETIKVLDEVIRRSVDNREVYLAYLYQGYAYFSLPTQEMQNAQTKLEKAVAIDPEYVLREDEFAPDFLAFYKKVKESMTGIGFFESDTAQTNIFLDEVKIGQTPMKKELLAKVFLLRAVKPGYTTYETEIEIKKNDVFNVKIPLNADRNWKTLIRSSAIFAVLAFLLKSI